MSVLRFDEAPEEENGSLNLTAPSGAKKEIQMKTIILAVLAALSIGLSGVASADQERNAFPEGSVQVSAE